ncbi:MAG: hypothetical protein ABIG69_11875 [Bacteroidota bacterium]
MFVLFRMKYLIIKPKFTKRHSNYVGDVLVDLNLAKKIIEHYIKEKGLMYQIIIHDKKRDELADAYTSSTKFGLPAPIIKEIVTKCKRIKIEVYKSVLGYEM